MKTISVLVFLILISGCTEKEYKGNLPQIELHVLDTESSIIEGASVQLYESKQDWENRQSLVSKQITNSEGLVVFEKFVF
jgi:hypothetical protein